jgi:hypothetical protein
MYYFIFYCCDKYEGRRMDDFDEMIAYCKQYSAGQAAEGYDPPYCIVFQSDQPDAWDKNKFDRPVGIFMRGHFWPCAESTVPQTDASN